jgi:segregation and condensation protein A
MLMQDDEITWQTIIYDLIKSEEMDPWDIDLSKLASMYLEIIKKLKETNLFVSGKVILASAILLKIKSEKLVSENIAAFDQMMYPSDEIEQLDDFVQDSNHKMEVPKLLLKTPQPRKRKVTLNDLMGALQKAIEVNQRRIFKSEERYTTKAVLPEKVIDITSLIKNLYEKIKGMFIDKEVLTFTELVSSDKKEDKLLAFIPLLHLANESKVNLEQDQHFGEIKIELIRKPYY